MRIATFNLQSGNPNGLATSQETPSKTGSAITASASKLAACEADIVCLQEVRGAVGSPFLAQPAVAWYDYALARRRFNPRTPRRENRYGIAMYSRLPVLRSWKWWLPSWKSPLRHTSAGLTIRLEEQRRAIVALVDNAGQPIFVCGTHLAANARLGSKQLHWLEGHLDKLATKMGLAEAPRIIFGDLNMRPNVLRNQTSYTVLVEEMTFPSSAPRTQIDHVLGRGLHCHASRAELMPISDHLAVIADVVQG